jgi:phospholipase C
MGYAYRSREAFFELAPGETSTWLLPPCTAGKIIVRAFSINLPGSGSGGGGGGGGGGGHIARGRPTFGGGRFGHGIDLGNLGDLGPLVPEGGGMGPASGLTVELLQSGSAVATDPNKIAFDATKAGDIWALRITRKQEAPAAKVRYRLEVMYPSVLPVETRRIPARFFTRGFEQNWNQNPYLDYVRTKDNNIAYRWREDFALLYGKPRGDQYIPLSDLLKIPDITATKFTLSVGGGDHPIHDPSGMQRPAVPYVSLRIDAMCTGSRVAELEIPGFNPSVTLPQAFWFEVRLFLDTEGQGNLAYYPTVASPLLDALDRDITYPTPSGMKTVNVKAEAKKRFEDHIYQLQHTGSGPFVNFFDHYVRPYLVGRYEVEKLEWDASREDIVISYVGKQKPHRDRGRLDASLGDLVVSDMAPATPTPTTTPPRPGLPLPPVLAGHGRHLDLGTLAEATFSMDYPRLFETPLELPIKPEPPHPTPEVSPGALSKIDHIVVLMQENRSFDQVLGYLSRDGMLPRERLLSGDETGGREPRQEQVNGLLPGDNDRDHIRFQNVDYRSERTRTTAWPSFGLGNPCHGADCVERQVSDNMKGFLADFARKGNGQNELKLIMDYLTDAELPTYGALTREFAICDAWHCSHLGGTLPNRFISLTGDFSRDIYGSPEVENPDLAGFAPLEAATFFDHLTAHGVPWRLFEHGYSMLRLIRNYTFDETNIASFDDPQNGFEATARAGKLPVGVTFIEPDYIEAPGGNDDHAPADMINGQRLIARIVSALLDSPQWEKTLFIVTYDEHGGFYDHQPPPTEMETAAGRTPIPPLSPGEPRLGLRVPAFVISPFVPGMTDGKVNVVKTVFDHTAIPGTILRRFCGPRPPFMGDRTAAMPDLGSLLTLDTPRPRAELEQLAREMRSVAARPAARVVGEMPAAPLRRPAPSEIEDDFHGLIAYASAMTGLPGR